jgi:chitinase
MKFSPPIILAAFVLLLQSCGHSTSENTDLAFALEEQVEFRINAAGADYTDSNGDLFVADKAYVAGDFGFVGGSGIAFTSQVLNTADPTLYQSVRTDSATFSYVFDNIPAGDCDVTLYFFDNNPVGARLFDVEMEGVVVLDDFDIIAAAGGRSTAHNETITATVSDGQLNIDFIPVSGGGPGVFAISVVGP